MGDIAYVWMQEEDNLYDFDGENYIVECISREGYIHPLGISPPNHCIAYKEKDEQKESWKDEYPDEVAIKIAKIARKEAAESRKKEAALLDEKYKEDQEKKASIIRKQEKESEEQKHKNKIAYFKESIKAAMSAGMRREEILARMTYAGVDLIAVLHDEISSNKS